MKVARLACTLSNLVVIVLTSESKFSTLLLTQSNLRSNVSILDWLKLPSKTTTLVSISQTLSWRVSILASNSESLVLTYLNFLSTLISILTTSSWREWICEFNADISPWTECNWESTAWNLVSILEFNCEISLSMVQNLVKISSNLAFDRDSFF